MSSSNSPCAACKFLRRKCTQGCVFAPYFPPDQPAKFANVHRVFGASNVAKLLNELNPAQREDAVNSLAYEAQARISDPIYGCVGYISVLQNKLKQIQNELYNAKKELAGYIGPAALGPFLPPFSQFHHQQQQQVSGSSMMPYGIPGIGMGLGLQTSTSTQSQLLLREHHQQQIAEAQQLAAAVREQEILRSLEQHQQEMSRFNSGFVDGRGFNGGGGVASSIVVATGTTSGSPQPRPPALSLVLPQQQQFESSFHVRQHNQQQHQQQLQLHQYLEHQQPPPPTQQQQQQQQRAGSDEGRSSIGPLS